MQKISSNLNINDLQPEWLGSNLLISGIPNLTHLPGLTHLRITRPKSDQPPVMLVVFEQNKPCFKPDKVISDKSEEIPSMPFAKAAAELRGTLGWVDFPGEVRIGDEVEVLHVKS
ncbi:MAG: hypothetical protein HKN32_02585 [Flavobacteriales bacterium]|nr:hypothetical protein [Flavobacteriales bacterium]